MTLLLALTLRVSAVLAVALTASALLRRRSAALRHAVLAAGVVMALGVVPATLLGPEISLPVPGWMRPSAVAEVLTTGATPALAAETAAAIGADPATPTPITTAAIGRAALGVWLAGVAAGLVLLAAGVARLSRMAADAEPLDDERWLAVARSLSESLGVRRPVRLIAIRDASTPATWGVFSPVVALPAAARDWNEDRARVVLGHELAHVRRGDWAMQMIAALARALFWFNPLVWWSGNRLRHESEIACDDVVLATGAPPQEYARHLVDVARHLSARPRLSLALGMARASSLERRITVMMNPLTTRRTPSRSAWTTIVLSLAVVAAAVSAVRLGAQSGPAALTGQIFDSSGGVLPGVEVKLENDVSPTRSSTTDSSGRFTIAEVAPGTYKMQATQAGFRTLATEVVLKAPGDWQRTITLQVGDLMETVSVRAQRPSGPRSPAPTAEPLRVGGNIKAPRKLNNVAPAYPESLREAGLEGTVPMEVLIGADGVVASVRVLSAQVHPEFARAAAEAVRQWQFSPTLLNGAAIPVRMDVSVRFSLEN